MVNQSLYSCAQPLEVDSEESAGGMYELSDEELVDEFVEEFVEESTEESMEGADEEFSTLPEDLFLEEGVLIFLGTSFPKSNQAYSG